MARVVIPGFRKIEVSGGGEGGTTNYNDLTNKPSINNVPLVGNLRTVDLKLTDGTLTEEGVPAEAKTVGTKLEEQSTSLTELSEQLGNHTVKSDVPENAVFTDTVYDDTEVKGSIEEINSNLDGLEFGDVAGGKNLANINDFKLLTTNPSRYGYEWLSMKGGTYTFNITNGKNILYIGYKHNGEFVNPNSVVNNSKVQTITISDGDDIVIWYENGVTENTVTKLQLEVGNAATAYEPYIPSVKILSEEVDKQNENLDTLEYSDIAGGKNLLKWNTNKTITYNGVTFDATQNGKIKLSGTSVNPLLSDSYKGATFTLPKGTYTISVSNGENLFNIYDANGSNEQILSSMNGTFTLTEETEMYFGKWTANGTDMNYDIDVIIEEGDTATPYEPYIPSIKMLADEVDNLNDSLDSQGLLNKFDGKLEQGYKNASGTIIWDSTNVCIKNTISVSSGDKVTVKLDSVATRLYTAYRNNGVFVSEEINYNTNNVTVTIPSGANGLDITMVYDSTTTPSQVGNLYVYINNAIEELKNDLAPKKIELQNVDERVTIQDNGSFIINGFAFVNLLVTFNETLPQWSNFVRLPRPKGGNVTVYCENSVRFTIYSQDNLPGDCGTYDVVQSGTEIRLLVNYEVA